MKLVKSDIRVENTFSTDGFTYKRICKDGKIWWFHVDSRGDNCTITKILENKLERQYQELLAMALQLKPQHDLQVYL